ncbi:zinc-binding dehydrogenase [Mycolicibacterium mengxianglii]|uniref:zinc-binding dehydrogenase n=1 Tax=Mycolicibacterium mengxianglii TaxID=2736649 RepID=UPI0018D188A2|nr:zinc-binding dehydrogenase [Mycolicibacterium mengxianglii]
MSATAPPSASTMLAAVLRDPGGPEPLRLERVPIPQPGPGEVLVAVGALGLNNAEILQCRGMMPAPPGGIPGLECAGTVVGAGATGWRRGDRVAALTRAGAYAEYVVAPAGACMKIPDGVEIRTAAALLEAAATAWWNLVHRGRLQPGERVLIHGAAGGVGSLAVQLARALGATVIGTARGPVKTALCRQLGCHHVIDYGSTDVYAALRELVPGGVDLILDNQGAGPVAANIAALAPLGRLVIVGVASGTDAAVDLGALMAGAVEISSSSLGRLDDEMRTAICREIETEVLPEVVAGRLRPVLDGSFVFDEIAAAQRRFADPDRVGKVVVTLPGYISKIDAAQQN